MDETRRRYDARNGKDDPGGPACQLGVYPPHRKDGDVFYVAKPSQNAAETFFKLVKSSPNEAIFENPEHDFPQRIIYRRSGDKITARIEGTNNGKPAAMDYPFTKAACE